MRVFTHSEAGGHLKNEDAIGVLRIPGDPVNYVCALADGQNGRAGGAVAAKTAVNSCLTQAQDHSVKDLVNPYDWESVGQTVDRDVLLEPEAGFTTFIGLTLIPSFLIGISNGDSAVALFLDDKFVLLTEHQHKNPPIGSGSARLSQFSARINEPWKLLLMSDGVWKYVGWEKVIELCRVGDGRDLISDLREVAAENNGGPLADDFSVILIDSTATE